MGRVYRDDNLASTQVQITFDEFQVHVLLIEEIEVLDLINGIGLLYRRIELDLDLDPPSFVLRVFNKSLSFPSSLVKRRTT